jgi:general secretion pathway protein G
MPLNQPVPAKKRLPRWLRIVFWTLGIVWGVSILASVGMRGYTASHGGTEVTQARARLKALEISLWMRKKLNGSFPTEEEGLVSLFVEDPANAPDDKLHRAEERTKDPWHRRFQYRMPGKHHPESYDLSSFGPDGIEDTADDIKNW